MKQLTYSLHENHLPLRSNRDATECLLQIKVNDSLVIQTAILTDLHITMIQSLIILNKHLPSDYCPPPTCTPIPNLTVTLTLTLT